MMKQLTVNLERNFAVVFVICDPPQSRPDGAVLSRLELLNCTDGLSKEWPSSSTVCLHARRTAYFAVSFPLSVFYSPTRVLTRVALCC